MRAARCVPRPSSPSVRQSSTSAPSDDAREHGGVALAERRGEQVGVAVQARRRTTAARPAAARRRRPGATVSTTVPPMRAASRSARVRTSLGGLEHGAQRRELPRAPAAGRGTSAAWPRAPPARACRCAARAPAGGAGRSRRPRRVPARIPACGPAEQLVAREADEIAAVAQRIASQRLAGQLRRPRQGARADVVDQREDAAWAISARSRSLDASR